ncbi:MAG: hypothetical protein WC437_02450 [Patescibacteria group bacterium]
MIKMISINKNKIFFVFSLLVLFITNLYVNFNIRLLALVQDDLSYWNTFKLHQSDFFAFVFDTGANKLRPVLNTITYALFSLFGTKIWLFGWFNILFSFVIASVLYYFFYRISKNLFFSLILGIAFIVSRFAYYDITQVFGVMEAMGILLASSTLFLLWRYLNSEKMKYYWVSLGLFVALVFVHERYIALYFIFFVCILMIKFKWRNLLLLFLPAVPIFANITLKQYVFRIRPLDGTGGTAIADTFNINQFFDYVISGAKSLFGANNADAYLSGLPFASASLDIRLLTYTGFVIISIVTLIFFIKLFSWKKEAFLKIKNILLFCSFIIATLAAASVTFRQEMRWLYVAYVGLLFLISYVVGVLLKENKKNLYVYAFLMSWLIVTVITNMYFRNYYSNLYYWGNQTLGNEIYLKTVGKYGSDFWSYKTYIVTDVERLPLYTGNDLTSDTNTFFKQFQENERQKIDVQIISSVSEAVDVGKKTIILDYDSTNNRLTDISK